MILENNNHLRSLSCVFLIATLGIFAWILPTVAIAKLNACQEKLVPLNKQLSSVTQQGGVWSQFEKSRTLREQSVVAIQLDSKMNRLLFSLEYLCETLNGIPFNDLAGYVDKELRLKGEPQFRKELAILGKSKAEVEIWLTFRKFAVENLHRKLDETSVTETIKQAGTFFQRYVSFSNRIKLNSGKPIVDQAKQLSQDLDSFHNEDSNLAQASAENAQVPYWDFDENHGGS